MKQLLLILLMSFFGLIGCETVATTKNKKSSNSCKARVTFYCAKEDKRFRNKIAATSKFKAQEGRTVAINPKEIPYWTLIHIPFLSKLFRNKGYFIAEDTGKDVRSRKASKGQYPIIDVYVASLNKMKLLASTTPPYLDIEY